MSDLDQLKFTGYEPKPVMAAKMEGLVEAIKDLQEKIAKLEAGGEVAKKTTKTAKAAE